MHLPEFNRIDLSEASLIPLRFIARRAKLYAAFNRFRYQRHEISYAIDRYECMADQGSADPDLLRLANHFLEAVLAYDFWRTTYAWPALELTHMSVKGTANRISRLIGGENLESLYGDYIKNSRVPEHSHESYLDFLLVSEVRSTFDSLANLGNMFEEICREWFLPTYLGTLSEKHAIR